MRFDKQDLRERINNFDNMDPKGHMIWIQRYHKDVMVHSSAEMRAKSVLRWKKRWTKGTSEYRQVEHHFKFSLLKEHLLDKDEPSQDLRGLRESSVSPL